jgi:hypothetical protein
MQNCCTAHTQSTRRARAQYTHAENTHRVHTQKKKQTHRARTRNTVEEHTRGANARKNTRRVHTQSRHAAHHLRRAHAQVCSHFCTGDALPVTSVSSWPLSLADRREVGCLRLTKFCSHRRPMLGRMLHAGGRSPRCARRAPSGVEHATQRQRSGIAPCG